MSANAQGGKRRKWREGNDRKTSTCACVCVCVCVCVCFEERSSCCKVSVGKSRRRGENGSEFQEAVRLQGMQMRCRIREMWWEAQRRRKKKDKAGERELLMGREGLYERRITTQSAHRKWKKRDKRGCQGAGIISTKQRKVESIGGKGKGKGCAMSS